MKHLKLMLALVVSLFSMSSYAQDGSAVGEGNFFLYNVADEAFLTGANDWGTHASLGPQGFYCTLIANGGGYNIKTGTNTTQYLGSNGYVDAGASAWTFTPVEGKTNTYYLYNSGFGYLESTEGSTDLHAKDTQPTDEHGEWKLFTREDLWNALDLSSASETNPLDVSFLIESSCFVRNCDGFSSNQGTSNNRQVGGWTLTANQNNAVVSGPQAQGQSNTGCEFWNNTFDLFQTISVVNGKYIVAFDGFANNTNAVIYGNEVETPFTYTGSSYDFANTLIHISEFATNKSDVITVGNGTLKLGVKRNGGGWCVLDNAHLYYVGGVGLDDFIASYHAALEAAQGVNQSAKMNVDALSALQNALSTYSSVDETSQEALEEATSALSEATSTATSSIAAYAAANIPAYLAKMGGVLDLTNVYTTDAYNTWYANVQDNYDAGTIPNDIVGTLNADGAYNAGWRAANHIDEVLLSAWTIGGTHYNDFDGPLYINTWSNEGDSDGSGMTTPFFEYFGGEGSSIGATIIQATIPGLNPEKNYKVSALARVRTANDGTAPAADGVTFTAGDSDPVNVSDGTQSTSETRMYYKTVEAIAKPDDAGNLVITFTVNADNLIHWLAFKNVMYEEIDITPEKINELFATIRTPHNVQLDAAAKAAKTNALNELDTESYLALEEAVNACNASADEYATVKLAIDEAVAVHETLSGLPAEEEALYQEIMDQAIPAYQAGMIESAPQIGSIAVALAYLEQGTRRIVIKQQGVGAVIDRGYPDNNLSGQDVTTGNVNVAYNALSPWMISESKAYTWHVNTWSGEGSTDGSNMLTPFLEYWRGGNDRAGLDDVTISNKLVAQNLGRQNVTLYPNSVYEVSGHIRAYKEYTADGDITGVSIFAGDFESDLSEQASTEVSNGKALIYGTFTVKGNTNADGELEFGIKTNGTNANWIAAKDFTIKYISDNIDDIYEEAYYKALAKAQEDIASDNYANVTGSEREALQACIDNDPNVPGTVSFKDATAAIKDANSTFVAAKEAYDTFAAAASMEDPNLQYAAPAKKTAWIDACSASPANAEDALAKAAEITTALRAYYESHALAEGVDGAVNVSDQIANNDATNGNDGWTWTGNKNAPRNTESWTDSQGNNTYMYFDGGNWGATSWTTTMEQTIPLPSGKYLLTAKGRASTNVTLTMSAGEASVNLPNIGASGNVFDRGWNDSSVEFESDGSATIHVEATTGAQHEWFSIGDFRLIRLELYAQMADDADYAALNAAIADAEANTLGFMAGEYAPYNNIDALQALAEAKAIDQNVENTKDAVTAVTTALESAVWTANTAEVSAIDLTKCFDGSTDGSNRYYAIGWDKAGGSDAYNTRLISGSDGNPGMTAVDNELALFTKFGTNYGKELGYTMPLAANTLYKFTFKYGAFGENKEITTNLALASEDGETTVSISPASFTRANNSGLANADIEAWFDYVGYFKIEEAGNYVLTLTKNDNGQQRQIVMGNISILSCEAIEIDENVDYDYSLAVAGVDVTLTRTIKASTSEQTNYNTLTLPFSLTSEQIKAAFGDDAQAFAYDGNEGTTVNFSKADEIQANVPVLLTTSTTSSAPYTFENVTIEAAGDGPIARGTDVDFVGTYAAETYIPGMYFISGNLIYEATESTKAMKGTRAYFRTNGGEVNTFSISGETITAIKGIDGMISNAKAIYNLQGQKVNTPVKGNIYIIDGKKVLVK